jgi:hypothetical protein
MSWSHFEVRSLDIFGQKKSNEDPKKREKDEEVKKRKNF